MVIVIAGCGVLGWSARRLMVPELGVRRAEVVEPVD
jgi:hypothetical protein